MKSNMYTYNFYNMYTYNFYNYEILYFSINEVAIYTTLDYICMKIAISHNLSIFLLKFYITAKH